MAHPAFQPGGSTGASKGSTGGLLFAFREEQDDFFSSVPHQPAGTFWSPWGLAPAKSSDCADDYLEEEQQEAG